MIYMGKINRQICRLSSQALNSSVLITGQSGSGKTCRMHQIEADSAAEGKTVIVIETTGSHTESQILPGIRSSWFPLAKRINACKDGLAIPILPPGPYSDTLDASQVSFINSVVNAFAIPARLGNQQIMILRNAFLYAMKTVSFYPSDTDAIINGLKKQGKPGAELYSRFWSLFSYRIFRPCWQSLQLPDNASIQNAGSMPFQQLLPGSINIIDLLDADELTQKISAEIFLFSLYNYAKKQIEQESLFQELIIFIDEFQNLPLGSQSIIKKLLHEGRKYRISLVLATQTLQNFSPGIISSINQAAARLYFRPVRNEIHRLAKEICPDNAKQYAEFLANLNTGESIASGQLQIGSAVVKRPLILN